MATKPYRTIRKLRYLGKTYPKGAKVDIDDRDINHNRPFVEPWDATTSKKTNNVKEKSEDKNG